MAALTVHGKMPARPIRARLFNSDGSRPYADFALNTTTAGIQLFPQIAVLANAFVAIWQDNGSTDIRGRCPTPPEPPSRSTRE